MGKSKGRGRSSQFRCRSSLADWMCESAVSFIWKGCQAAVSGRTVGKYRSGLGKHRPAGQYLLDRARWHADAVQAGLSEYVKEELGSLDAILILNEVGFLKKASIAPRCSDSTAARRPDREQPAGSLSWLRQRAGLCAADSGAVSAPAVGRRLIALPGGKHP